ncbi:avidin-related protein 2-like [Crotalus tigris]|uniref:avidin-related protein 2-like n=1 Tax=Crotalus tigris TaxID=88082 RepID=UPI00192F7239|nr:avidin-related protein 2-like [Crotalus tigris]
MALGQAALMLFAFLLDCSGTFAAPQNSEPDAKCSLTGSWKNDLNSTMEIKSANNTGVFRGVYRTAVSDTTSKIQPSPLLAVQHLGDQPVFGFTVNWNFTESITVFVGQCLVGEDGKEQLKTTWLLRDKVESAADDWAATRVGTDTFWRTK